MFLEVGNGLLMSVFGGLEIFLVQSRDGDSVLARHHHVENHDLRLRFEDAAVRRSILAAERRGVT